MGMKGEEPFVLEHRGQIFISVVQGINGNIGIYGT
jgi:hypothetical protein